MLSLRVETPVRWSAGGMLLLLLLQQKLCPALAMLDRAASADAGQTQPTHPADAPADAPHDQPPPPLVLPDATAPRWPTSVQPCASRSDERPDWRGQGACGGDSDATPDGAAPPWAFGADRLQADPRHARSPESRAAAVDILARLTPVARTGPPSRANG